MTPDISKTTFTFTVLHRSDAPLHNIQHALAESYDGDACGFETGSETTAVPPERVVAELLALGNDGRFFDDFDEEEL